MRKLVLVLLIGCVLLGVGSVGVADAQLITELCWQKQPFPDILRLALTQSGTQIIATGLQFVNGLYSLPFAGSLFILGNQAILGGTLIGDLNPTNFNGSAALAMTAVLSLSTGGGPSTTIGIDGKFALSQTTLAFVVCPAGPTTHDAGTATSVKPEGL